jgi:hypothetical protein
MSNDEKKADNDSVRAIASSFNTLNRLVREKTELVASTPEISLPAEYSDQSSTDVLEDEAFANQCEQVAALQFSGQKKEAICTTLEIELKDYKKIVVSQEFIDIKKRIAEDNKVNILSKILNQVDSAVMALAELMDTADEDRVRLNAAALVLEHASRLLEEQKSQFPNIQNVIRDAATTGEPVIMNLAQVILNQRRERGLDR